jgi:hypothetical protein
MINKYFQTDQISGKSKSDSPFECFSGMLKLVAGPSPEHQQLNYFKQIVDFIQCGNRKIGAGGLLARIIETACDGGLLRHWLNCRFCRWHCCRIPDSLATPVRLMPFSLITSGNFLIISMVKQKSMKVFRMKYLKNSIF